MNNHDLFFQSIDEVSKLIKNKDISPVELTKNTLTRIEMIEPNINAFIRIMEEGALKQATILEAELSKGIYRGPLHGIPISIKDIFETKGYATTAGSKILSDWIPDKDATVIQKLKEAGAIIIGKNNMHEFSSGGTNENPHYGATHNPWDLRKISGGSSGGSAASVATGMSFGALGSDVGGSIRLPAANCGIVGLKPTYGRVSRYGSWPFSFSADHIGTMGRTVKDAALMLQAVAGYDLMDQTSSKRAVDVVPTDLPDNLKGIVVGICREYFFENLHPEMKTHIELAISKLEQLGACIKEISIPSIVDVPQHLLNMMRTEWYGVHKPFIKQYKEFYGEDLQGRFSAAEGISAQEYLNAHKFRKDFLQEFKEKMEGIDVLVSPTMAMFPFDIGSMTIMEKEKIFGWFKTHIFNFTGYPALSMPCGFNTEGLPVGLQIMGKPFMEKKLLEIAMIYEQSESYYKELGINQAYIKEPMNK